MIDFINFNLKTYKIIIAVKTYLFIVLLYFVRTVNRHWWTSREYKGRWDNVVEGTLQMESVPSEQGLPIKFL
jgi:hypothetical protein